MRHYNFGCSLLTEDAYKDGVRRRGVLFVRSVCSIWAGQLPFNTNMHERGLINFDQSKEKPYGKDVTEKSAWQREIGQPGIIGDTMVGGVTVSDAWQRGAGPAGHAEFKNTRGDQDTRRHSTRVAKKSNRFVDFVMDGWGKKIKAKQTSSEEASKTVEP